MMSLPRCIRAAAVVAETTVSTSSRSMAMRAVRSTATAAATPLLRRALPRPAHPLISLSSSSSSFGSCRYFSATLERAKTETLLNPQTDDDGKEMRLEITARAAKRLTKVMEKDANPRLALRIQVESGGCHGFQYVMSLVTLPDQLPTSFDPPPPPSPESKDGSPAIREDDTIFAYAPEGDETATIAGADDPLSGPKIILDTPSLELLNGSKVDFTMELIGSQFKIVDNPLATSSCGCGTSFDIKV